MENVDKRNEQVKRDFMVNRDETGKLVVNYWNPDKKYYIEYIEPKGMRRTDWGSYNPSTGNIENKKGASKYTGGIKEEDSVLTKENGFEVLHEGGGSGMWEVHQMYDKWKKDNGYT